MNLSGIPNTMPLGKLLRLPLKMIPKNSIVPILQGKLRGKRWIVGSSTHGCWIGSYEYECQKLFVKTVRKGGVVFDIGANVGFYTLLASELVGSEGRVVAFEPLHENILYLKKHLRLNRIQNVDIIEAAVGSNCGKIYFKTGESRSSGHISSKGGIRVNVFSLDALVRKKKVPIPDYLKIDVEGAEMEVLLGAKSILRKNKPPLFLSTHGKDICNICCEFLRSYAYGIYPIGAKEIEKTNHLFASSF